MAPRISRLRACILAVRFAAVGAWLEPGNFKLPPETGPEGHDRGRWGGTGEAPTGEQATQNLDRVPEGRCNPAGYSHRYPQPYILPESVGALYGYDVSDQRYRFPPDIDSGGKPRYAGQIPGFDVTLAYADAGTKGHLWLASKHLSTEDLAIQKCLGVNAILDLTAPEKWWFSGRSNFGDKGYPFYDDRESFTTRYGATFPKLPQMTFPHEFWYNYYDYAETWLDEKMAAGMIVLVYDEEGCEGAAALSVAYAMRKLGQTHAATYANLLAKRPCVADIEPHSEWIYHLKRLEPR